MSTILDALKKSEQERKLNNIPTLSDMPAPQEPQRWPVYMLIVFVVLLLVLLGVFFKQWQFGSSSNQSGAELVISNETVASTEDVSNADQTVVVNVVSYADDPEQRFVMINGKMFRENEFVRAGIKVEKITKEGVVLNERGKRSTRKP